MPPANQSWQRRYGVFLFLAVIVIAAGYYLGMQRGDTGNPLAVEEDRFHPFSNVSPIDSSLVVRVKDSGFQLWIADTGNITSWPYAITTPGNDIVFRNKRTQPVTLQIHASSKTNPYTRRLDTETSGNQWTATFTANTPVNYTFWMQGENQTRGKIWVRGE